jgi:L-lactate dehydrogenase complex protein LldE
MTVNSVQLFTTCLIDTLYPEIGRAIVKIMDRLGKHLEVPHAQTCCGQPAFNAGMRRQSIPLAKHMIECFEKTTGAIVTPSGSCAAMIRHGYLELFKDDSAWLPRAQSLASRTFELTEYLVDFLGVTDLGARYPGKAAYHASCHLLRDLGIDRQPRLLLSAVRQLEMVELPYHDECCGFGGVFSVEHPELSSAFLDRKIANIEKSQAPCIISCDAGCLTNINGGLHRRGLSQRAVHIAEILAQT